MAIFVISSIVLIFSTKPLVNKYINKDAFVPTNTYRFIGQKGLVIQDIREGQGQVKVDGEVWSATSSFPIEKGSQIEVLKIDGVKLVVKEV